jgi:hypothetical protein
MEAGRAERDAIGVNRPANSLTGESEVAESGYLGIVMIRCSCCERNWPNSTNSILDKCLCLADYCQDCPIANGIACAQIRGLWFRTP